jgi:SAM-dependent methyltransferase
MTVVRDVAALRREFDNRGPWVTRFEIDGQAFGGEYDASADTRLSLFKQAAGPLSGKRILELGPLEGGHTLELARTGARVVAIEGRESNYNRCLFIKAVYGLTDVEFVLGDVRSLGPAHGQFDVIFNVGVLYHLDEPWKLLQALGGLAPRMFLWTHCSSPEDARASIEVAGVTMHGRVFREGMVRRRLSRFLPGRWWLRPQLKDPLSGLQSDSFWPASESLEAMLKATGWGLVQWLSYDPDAVPGPAASIWAEHAPSGD